MRKSVLSTLLIATALSGISSSSRFDEDSGLPFKPYKEPEPKNKFNFTEEELEEYRKLSKKDRKNYLKARGK